MIQISIIVPVYNIDKYINKCIDSILNQSFVNFELILVDDGSTDDSGLICDKYANEDSRIRVIHKENGGLSSARNAGLDIAKGKYIGFVDSDDYIDKNMYKYLFEVITRDNSELAICNYREVYEDSINIGEKNKINIPSSEIYNKYEILNKLYTHESGQIVVAWNKLYRKELFDEERYPIGRIHEDEFLIHRILYKCNKISYINDDLYYYLQRENSIMKESFSIRKIDVIDALKDRMDFFRKNNEVELLKKSETTYIAIFLSIYVKAYKQFNNVDNELRNIKSGFNENIIHLLKNPYNNWKAKILWCVFYFNPRLYIKICNNLKSRNLNK